MNRLFLCGLLLAVLTTTGCVGWGPCGDECFRGPFRGVLQGLCSTCGDDCCSCDGYAGPYGNIRQTLACGSGCGEVYYGEWTSNPPDTCNECDARGHAYGVNGRFPWLCNPWTPWGVQYRPNWVGYGNPYRGTHPGYADYGYQGGRFGVMDAGCGTGCATGCATGDCAPNAPQSMRPIPNQLPKKAPSQTTGKNQKRKRAVQVSYVSPLVQKAKARTQSVTPVSNAVHTAVAESAGAVRQYDQTQNYQTQNYSTHNYSTQMMEPAPSANRASFNIKSTVAQHGRLRQIRSLR